MPDSTSRDLAANAALEVERQLESGGTHHDLAEAFGQAVRALAEDDPLREFLTWESWLYEFQLPSHPQERPPSDPFIPFITSGDGRQHPPRIVDFPTSAVEYVRIRLRTAENPSARARLADFLWQREQDFKAADEAATAYIAAALAFPASQPGVVPVEYLLRAATLSRSLGRDRPDLREAIQSIAELDNGSHLCPLVLATAEEIARDSRLADLLLGRLVSGADAAAQGGHQRDPERYCLSSAIELAAARHDQAAAREFRMRRALSFEHEATERAEAGPLIHLFLLQEAMKSYAALGMSDALERVKAKVHEASQRASENLHEMSVEQSIPTAELEADIEQLIEKGKGRSPWWHLQGFAVRRLWPAWSQISKQTEDLAREAPLQAMVRQVVIGPDGRPYERPSEREAERQFNEIRTYAQNIQFEFAIFAVQVAMMRERHVWTEELVLNAFRKGILFPPEIIAAIRPGIQGFEAGRHWEAIHVLIPQVERVVRQLARELGEDTYRYVSTTGEIHWISLKALLQLEKVRAVLGRIRPDLPNELGYLLIDSRGLNLRDDLAHGILPPGDDMERHALLCVLILLTLSILARPVPEPGQAEDTADKGGAET